MAPKRYLDEPHLVCRLLLEQAYRALQLSAQQSQLPTAHRADCARMAYQISKMLRSLP